MSTQLIICLIIFVLTLVSFIVGKITMGTTAMIAMMLLLFTGCLDAQTALSCFSNPNTIIMASMFVISSGFSRTEMVGKLSDLVKRVSKGSFRKVLAGYVIIAAILCQFIPSAMATFSIVFPLACAMADDMGFSRSKMMFPIGIICISCVSTLPIGNAAVTYLTYNGYLEAYQYTDYQFEMLDFMIGRLPAFIFMIFYAIFIAPRFCPEHPVTEVKEIDGVFHKPEKSLSRFQNTIGYISFFGVIVMLLTQQLHKIPNWEITLTGAIIMVTTGVPKPKDAYNAIGLGGMVLLYVGMLSMANALTATGAGDVMGSLLASIVGSSHNNYLIGLMFFLVPFILTQVMMNAAVINIFMPIAIVTCKSLGCSPKGAMILVMISSLTAFMTPMATPSVSMMMGLGGYDQKTMFKMSWLPAILMCILNVFWVMTIFPAF